VDAIVLVDRLRDVQVRSDAIPMTNQRVMVAIGFLITRNKVFASFWIGGGYSIENTLRYGLRIEANAG
jgi:hypothetical protein